MRIFLFILSKIYALLMRLRAFLYRRGIFKTYQSSLKVISIGNVTAGGTGKTPHCIYLVQLLSNLGYKPVVLSRGYKGCYRGVYQVEVDDGVDVCGDEPLLIRRKTNQPVILARNRVQGGRYIESNKLGNIIILDDGLQHLRLRRDLEIVLINVGDSSAIRDILDNRVLPFGLLREDRHMAIERADLCILSHRKPLIDSNDADPAIVNLIPNDKTLISSFFEADGLFSYTSQEKLTAPATVVAFCAIANAQAFFSTLQSLGYDIHDTISRRDHYNFSHSDIELMKKKYPDMPLVCTEKDAVRLTGSDFPSVYVLKGSTVIKEHSIFLSTIEKTLEGIKI